MAGDPQRLLRPLDPQTEEIIAKAVKHLLAKPGFPNTESNRDYATRAMREVVIGVRGIQDGTTTT